MLRELRDRLLLGLPEMMPPPGEAEHFVDVSVIDRGGAVTASGLPVEDAAVRAEAAEKVVEDVVPSVPPTVRPTYRK